MVAALAQALRCDLDERDHLLHLAGYPAPLRRAGRHIRPGLIALTSRLEDVPACIYTDLGEIVWKNALLSTLLGYGEKAPGRDSNMIWRMFTDPAERARAPEEDWPRLAAVHVADLRATYSRRGGDSDVTALVNDLLEASTEFRELWQRHEVSVRRSDLKRAIHPEVGTIDLRCEVMLTPDADLNLLAFFPSRAPMPRKSSN